MFRYSWNDSSVCSSRTERLCWTTRGANPAGGDPSAAARSPLASTSMARTRLPARAPMSASAAVMVLRPVPPLPATKMTRRARSVASSNRTPAIARLTAVDDLQDLCGVPAGLDIPPLALDGPVRPDQEGRARHPHVLATHELLLDPEVLGLDEATVRVADQRDAQRALLDESLVALRCVRRHSVDGDTRRGECLVEACELLPLEGATGRVVLGIEVQHGATSLEVRVAHAPAIAGLEIEVRESRPDGHDHRFLRAQPQWSPSVGEHQRASARRPDDPRGVRTTRAASLYSGRALELPSRRGDDQQGCFSGTSGPRSRAAPPGADAAPLHLLRAAVARRWRRVAVHHLAERGGDRHRVRRDLLPAAGISRRRDLLVCARPSRPQAHAGADARRAARLLVRGLRDDAVRSARAHRRDLAAVTPGRGALSGSSRRAGDLQLRKARSRPATSVIAVRSGQVSGASSRYALMSLSAATTLPIRHSSSPRSRRSAGEGTRSTHRSAARSAWSQHSRLV